MKTIPQTTSARAHAALPLLLLLTLALAAASCKRSGVNGNADSGNSSGNSTAAGEISTTPPFSTKEPERYQATIVTKGGLGEQSNVPGMSALTTREMQVARDGQQRRVDAELYPGMKVSYLQTSAGMYMLIPARKIYVEMKQGDAGLTKNLSPEFSPDKLLNQSAGGARYELLGKEDVNGRVTTKYRVTATSKNGETQSVTESLIWIDESLGMPVKSETTTTGGAYNGAMFSMELRDIKQEVDSSVFVLPTDYKKVDYEELSRQAAEAVRGAASDKK